MRSKAQMPMAASTKRLPLRGLDCEESSTWMSFNAGLDLAARVRKDSSSSLGILSMSGGKVVPDIEYQSQVGAALSDGSVVTGVA